MRVFHVKHSRECAPAPLARPALPRCLERPGGPVPSPAPPATRPASPAGCPARLVRPLRRRVSSCRASCVVRRAPPHCSLLASAVPNPSVRSRHALRLMPCSFLCAVADVRARACALATCSCCDRFFGGRLHLAPCLAPRPSPLRAPFGPRALAVFFARACLVSRSRVSPCALLRASPGPALSRDPLCSADLLAANVSRETFAPLPHPPAPRPGPAGAAPPRAPWRPCPRPEPPPAPPFSASDASRALFEFTLFSPLTAPRPSLPLRAVAPPRPPPSRPTPPPRPSLPFSCGLLRFPGLLATMFHVKHSSAFALVSISGSAFAHCPPRLSRVFVAALSLAPRALVRLLACPFLLRALRLRPISLPHAFPSPAPPRSRPPSVLPHTFLMITRELLNLLPRYSLG